MVILNSNITENIPYVIIYIFTSIKSGNLLIRIKAIRLPCISSRIKCRSIFICHSCKITGSHNIRKTIRGLKIHITTVFYSYFSCFRITGCYQYYTVSTPRTIYSCSRSILQNLNRSNIRRIQ